MSFFLGEKLSITVQKFSKCLKDGKDRLRKGNLWRRGFAVILWWSCGRRVLRALDLLPKSW